MLRHLGSGAIAGLVLFGVTVVAQSHTTGHPSVQIDLARGGAGEARLRREMEIAQDKVVRYFGADGPWGGRSAEGYDGPLIVSISTEIDISMALIPAWRGERGRIAFPAARVDVGPGRVRVYAATVHEVVHVHAPNQNRFLAEGLAVYLHEHLQGPRAYPNFGVPLRRAARRHADADLAALDTLPTPCRLHDGSRFDARRRRCVSGTPRRLDETAAYVVAGSFVQFLIERYGVARFRRLYALTPLDPGTWGGAGSSGRYAPIYGRSLVALQREWSSWLRLGARAPE